MPYIDTLDELVHQKPDANPMIYAYTDEQYPGCLKVGYTAVDVDKRVAQQYPTKRPDGTVPYKIVLRESAMYSDGTSFTDHDVHRALKKKHIESVGGEWFKCTVDDVKAAIVAVKNHTENIENRTGTFKLRPEQEEAVNMTKAYFENAAKEGNSPKFLWNAKMRFGKTFATYKLAKSMDFKRVLILTFKPAVQVQWREDLMTHVDFEGWQFISRPQFPNEPNINDQYVSADKSKPIVCFGSFQDFLGYDKNTGGFKEQHKWVRDIDWDLVVFDEYHFGAWKENAKKLFEQNDEEVEEDLSKYNRGDAYDETWLPITTSYYLYLSGTPFRSLNSGEFIEEQVYNWTYSDEQRAKANWVGDNNPYAALPKMVLLTYRLPNSIEKIARQGEFDEFDLNLFFSAEGKGSNARFKYENYVQKWLELIRGDYSSTLVDELKQGAEKPPMPFTDVRLKNVLNHTVWFLPNVASCEAMYNLLKSNANTFYHDYEINLCAGPQAGIGASAIEPVQNSMKNPLESKTITLTCGKLVTGVTIKPWTGIFMLRNLSSPETYFQAAFRVQSPWEITNENGSKEIVKHECYVFDFALDRALRQIADYSRSLDISNRSAEQKVGEFISFLPVLAYNGYAMEPVDAAQILDLALVGITATLLAKRWESALLVNVDNDTLSRLLANKEAMDALMKIEGFRSLNDDIKTIINKSEAVKKAKKEGKDLTPKEKKELSEEEKEYKSKRKLIQEKLIKFATRIPVFMYLTDYREETLQDVITQLEPALFKKVTGLDVKDFQLLCSLNVFNEGKMNEAVLGFRRYEDSSLSYTGINKHEGEKVGLFATVLSREDYDAMSTQLSSSMIADKVSEKDIPTSNPFFSAITDDFDEEFEEPIIVKEKSAKVDPLDSIKEIPHSNNPYLKQSTQSNRGFTSVSSANNKQQSIKSNIEFEIDKLVVGAKVQHKAFGVGEIVEITNNVVHVKFGDSISKFQTPFAFTNGFLKFI